MSRNLKGEPSFRAVGSGFLAAVIAVVAGNAAMGQAALDRPGSSSVVTNAQGAVFRVDRDIVYGNSGGEELKLDIYVPPSGSKPMRAVVFVHGGGWQAGDKSNVKGAVGFVELLKRGYLVVSINYRLAPQYKFPAQIEDVKCAIRFLRANAGKYQIDPDHIGVMGASAGGHLVALLGLAGPAAGWDGKGGHAEQASGVQAVVDMFGPTDLTAESQNAPPDIGMNVFGTTNRADAVLLRASPVTYITNGAPPFLILQGENDRLVPPSQSQELHDKLKAAGVDSTLVLVKNAGHGFAPVGGNAEPSRAELSAKVADFFDRTLKR